MSGDCKPSGVFYTPPGVARYIVQTSIKLLLETGRRASQVQLLDPACGDGVFLQESLRCLTAAGGGRASEFVNQIHGVDIDSSATQLARERLAACAACDPQDVAQNIRNGDALIAREVEAPPGSRPPAPPIDWPAAFPHVFRDGGFDVVVGNPPYVNIRLLTKHRGPAVKRYLSEHYRCAQRAYDLYVLFLEQAYRLLRPGGICGMIVPNKVAEMEYSRGCRHLLLERTSLLKIVDVSTLRLFSAASVFPYILIWRKQQARAGHSLAVISATCESDLEHDLRETPVLQSGLSADQGFDLHGAIDIEARVDTEPLSERATLCSGTTGFVAEQLAQQVVERDIVHGPGYHDFIVSRNIDRFVIRRGNVRFMKRQFRKPALPENSSLLSADKKRLFRGAKIVVAGMTRRLEAAWDRGGLALGVQVYAIKPTADDPYFVLGLLNSRLLTYLFRLRFRAKQLSGGYFAINKRQLGQLPIRIWPRRELPEDAQELSRLVRRMITLPTTDRAGTGSQIDAAIDNLVYRMYNVSQAEIEEIESQVV